MFPAGIFLLSLNIPQHILSLISARASSGTMYLNLKITTKILSDKSKLFKYNGKTDKIVYAHEVSSTTIIENC